MSENKTENRIQGALTVPAMPAGQLALPEWAQGNCDGDFLTSLPVATAEEKVKVFDYLNADGLPPESMVNKSFKVRHILTTPISFTDETGQVVNLIRTLLILDNGDAIDFRSPGILKSLRLITRLLSAPPWNPPLELTLLRVQCSGDRSMYKLVLSKPAETKRR